MPTYIGFSTINANLPRTAVNINPGLKGSSNPITKPVVYGKKFRAVDEQLVIRDFINALNIRQGEKVGQPQYGSTVWSFVFEPNTADVQFRLESEIRRVASLDPRMQLNYVKAFPKENGILVEVEMAVQPFNNPGILNIFFDSDANKAILQY